MNVIIFGPPGAGKGTQANNAVNEFNLFKVSTGDILRNEIDKKTKFGEIIKFDGQIITLLITKSELSSKLALILNKFPIKDLEVTDPPVEELIGEVIHSGKI